MASPTLLARPTLHAFGRRMRVLRLEAGLTQTQLARRSYMLRSFISRIERGIANPSLQTIALIAAALKCNVVDLFVDDGGAPGRANLNGQVPAQMRRRIEVKA